MGLDLGVQRQHRRCAFGKTRIPEQVLGHQHVVQRAVDAFEKQAHVALVVFARHTRDSFKQAVCGPDVITGLTAEVGMPSR